MLGFFDAATGFPTAVLTVALCVVLFYWLLGAIGLVDIEDGILGLDLDLDADGLDAGSVGAYMVAFGLGGVPFSVVITLIVLLAWMLCCLAAMWILPIVPLAPLSWLAGALALVASVVVAIPATAVAIRPLRGLFVTHSARSNESFVGETCRILSRSVERNFGRAEVETGGASLNIKVWAEEPNTLVRGSVARIMEYDPGKGGYLVIEEAAVAGEE